MGLSTAWVGMLLALAFAIPALGLNPYGRNPAEVTLLAEAFAITLYLGGAICEVIRARLLAPYAERRASRFSGGLQLPA